MKKNWVTIIIFSMMVCLGTIRVQAEPSYDDTAYWTEKCSKAVPRASDVKACKAFRAHLASKSDDLNKQLKDIASKRSEILKNISEYQKLIDDYANQSKEVQAKIGELSQKIRGFEQQINDIQKNIDDLMIKIADKQKIIDEIKGKLKKRMVEKQPTMRMNSLVELLLGAKSFDEILRILSGLDAIAKSDQKAHSEFLTAVEELNKEKADLGKQKGDLETAKTNLDVQKKALNVQAEKIMALKARAEVVQDAYESQSAQLEAQGNTIAGDIASIKKKMASITTRLEQVPETNPHNTNPSNINTASGWVRPVNGAYRSAGTWYYSGGGVHLGYDFAAAVGTPVLAVGNGVILKSADGCPTIGGIGSGCGPSNGGSYGGGNQVYLLTKINGNLYAIKYLHLQQGSPIATGTIVMAGQQIGLLGSSGNSSGPHCHIEVFYLGNSSNFASYAQSWNGDLAFGAGWGHAALANTCSSRGGRAPCRLRPESFFGGE
ncbi:murein hydrolase activator EnvC [Bulleidia sp. zg-1006]|uniref:murein hydrolase activator EnvC family protein n=1 Tax=Bulleidia sp. zg-1006 TaxID=2806552 RepID=UPI00193AD2D1|nr:M23 family metallopeptidase [Bulleidia sp. zg-1006]QRG86846.1 peptidoglycan DD-metalloendopeptidase family protein [Bulleidia sp. zg-1006]